MSNLTQYDPVLGWTNVPHYASADFRGDARVHVVFDSVAHGIDRSRHGGAGGILVVGGSFGAGPGLFDEQTWPAVSGRPTGILLHLGPDQRIRAERAGDRNPRPAARRRRDPRRGEGRPAKARVGLRRRVCFTWNKASSGGGCACSTSFEARGARS